MTFMSFLTFKGPEQIWSELQQICSHPHLEVKKDIKVICLCRFFSIPSQKRHKSHTFFICFWIGLNSPSPGEGSAREPGPDRREPAGAQIAAKPMGKHCISKKADRSEPGSSRAPNE